MANTSDYNTSPPSGEQESCIDRDGREILDGFLYTPGHDACQVCTCFSGSPGLCRTVLCAPPSNCNSFRVKDRCCEWVCIDDVRTGDDGEPEHGATDIGLRLVACGVTAIFSLALLFFLIYRLRQRKMRDHAAAVDRVAEGIGSGPGDQGSIDSVAMTHLSGQTGDTSSRGYMYGWMWWKPQEEFVSPPPPPSYDDAVANDRHDYYYDERDDDHASSSGSDAPSYSQIHHDAVLQTHQSSMRTPTPNLSAGLPVGATLVLPQPAPPLTDLHHVDHDHNNSMRSYPSMVYSSASHYDYTDCDVPAQTRRSRSRNPTPNSSLGLPAGATLVLPQPAPPISDLHHVEYHTSTRRSYPCDASNHVDLNRSDETSTRRSRSRHMTVSSSRGLTPSSSHASSSHVPRNASQPRSDRHSIECGHRTLPSSRARRSQHVAVVSAEMHDSPRLVVPNQRSTVSNASLTTSIDV